mgnify:CR=1 FL=1
MIGRFHDDVAGDAADVGHVERLERTVKVGHELVLKGRTVLALEADLVVVDQAKSLGHGYIEMVWRP